MKNRTKNKKISFENTEENLDNFTSNNFINKAKDGNIKDEPKKEVSSKKRNFLVTGIPEEHIKFLDEYGKNLDRSRNYLVQKLFKKVYEGNIDINNI
jgi:hypothetical protein